MNHEFIRVTTQGPVTTVTLQRPEVLNAIHRPMHAELEAAFDAFAAADDQYVCVVTGAGDRTTRSVQAAKNALSSAASSAGASSGK